MHRLLIESYVKQINKKDIVYFGAKNNISLTDEDADILYHYLNNYWQELLYGDKDKVLDSLNGKLDGFKVLAIKNLFDFYLEKYQDLL